jgi:Flp pilus assembly protein TadG
MPWRRDREEDGQATIELVIGVPLLFLFLMLIVYAARLPEAASRVGDAAEAAARAASASSTGASAKAAANTAAQATLVDRGVTCRHVQVTTNLSGYRPGGTVSTTVSCDVDQSDLGLLVLPGTRTVTASFTAPIDLAATATP